MLLNEMARPFIVLELAALGLLLIAKLLPILPSAIVWLIFSLFWLAFTLTLFIAAKSRRKFMLFFIKDSFRFRSYLSGGVIMLLDSSIAAVPLALALLIGLAYNTALFQWAVVLCLPIVFLLLNKTALFERVIKEEALFYIKQQSILKIAAAFSILLMTLLALFYMQIPVSSNFSLIDMVNLARNQVQITDDILNLFVGIYAGLDGVSFFFFQKAVGLQLSLMAKLGAALMLTLKSALFILPIVILLRGISWLAIANIRRVVKGQEGNE